MERKFFILGDFNHQFVVSINERKITNGKDKIETVNLAKVFVICDTSFHLHTETSFENVVQGVVNVKELFLV